MKRFLLLTAAVAALLASCAKDPSLSEAAGPGYGHGTNNSDDGIIKGWVRLRLTDNATALRVGSFTRGEVCSGDPRIDEVAARLGATEISRVFGSDPRFTERHKRYGLHLWYDIRIGDEVPVSRAQSEFASLPGVAHVQPIYKIYPTDGYDYALPSEMKPAAYEGNKREMPFDDPYLPLQWHYDNDGSVPNSVEGADINLFETWELYGAGDPSVIVAVMDMGVQWDHPDLAANMWVNEGELNGEPDKDNDGNGIWNDIYGYNGMTRDGNIVPGSHGTHVAGTVAAVNNNGIGVAGVAGGTGNGDGARIMSCQIFPPTGGEDRDYPDVYRYAADNGAVISQNSWNNRSVYTELPEDIAVAFDYFINEAGVDENGNQTGPMKGGIIIFSAGNDHQPSITQPAADSRTVAVTSMLPNYKKAGYSNYGHAADIMAPGGAGQSDTEFGNEGKVYSTDLGGYSYKSGTSMAAPHISGIAALIVSHYGVGKKGFTPARLKEILLRSYRNVDIYQDRDVIADGIGVGLVDPTMIELSDPASAPGEPQAVSAEPVGEQKLELHITVPADGNGMSVSAFHISYAREGTSDGSADWIEMDVYNRRSVGEVAKYTIGNLEHETTYVFRVSSEDRFGNVSAGITEGRGTTIEHANLSPEIVKPLGRIELPNSSADPFRASLDLNDYFTDPDLPDDKLTFTAEIRDPMIASVEVSEEGIMTVTGLRAGDTFITITVKDLAGVSVSKNMALAVKSDPAPETEIVLPDNTLPQPFVKTVDLHSYFSGDVLSFVTRSEDSSVATAEVKEEWKMVVTGLKKGDTSIEVTAKSSEGSETSRTISVSVTENPGNGGNIPEVSAGELRLYPNPASDVINLKIGAAGAGSGTVRIYDSAARMVKNGNIATDADGVSSGNDISALSPGSYSLVVEHGGRTYTGNFLKL